MGSLFALWAVFALSLPGPAPAEESGDAIQVRELSFGAPLVHLTGDGQWVTVQLEGGEPGEMVGAPALPVMTLVFTLPRDHEPVEVRLESPVWEDVELPAPVIPFAGDVPGAYGDPDPVSPDPAIYESDGIYPPEAISMGGTGLGSRGTVVGVQVTPVRYDPQGRRLSWLREGRVVLNHRPRANGLPEGAVKRLRSFLMSEEGEPAVSYSEKGFEATTMPSLDGSPVDLVLVTTEEQSSVWQDLVDWKTKTGTPAVLRTMEEILDNYPNGVDKAERLRKFIRDAYTYWGAKYVLLAGPVEDVPMRFGHSWAWNQPAGVDIVSDYYYSCLDGTLNADGDGVFMEPIHSTNELGDGADMGGIMDLIPDIQVGRVPARSTIEAQGYLDKYNVYTKTPPDNGYLGRALMIAEVLFQSGWKYGDCDSCSTCPGEVCVTMDGVGDCEEVVRIVEGSGHSNDIEFFRMYERDYHWNHLPNVMPTSSTSDIIAEINRGMNIVQQVGHGDVDRWSVGSTPFPGTSRQLQIVGTDLGALENGPSFTGLTYAINCNSAAINFDCLALATLLNSNGGTITYVGSTNLDFPVAARAFQNGFYEGIFVEEYETMGESYIRTMEERALASPFLHDGRDNSRRFILYSLIYMGDPHMQLWINQPAELDLTFPAQVDLGQDEINVVVRSEGSPVEGARVTVMKEGETYAVGTTDASGSVAVPFYASTTGVFEVAASSYQSLTAVGTGQVNQGSAAALSVTGMQLLDNGTDGNGNGVPELGETISVDLTVTNTGTQTASGVQATLQWAETTWEGIVDLQETASDLGDIAGGSSAQDAEVFRIHIPRTVPEELEDELIGGDQMDMVFTVELTHSGGVTRSFDWTLSATQPVFSAYVNTVNDTPGDGRIGNANGRAENGETVDLSVGLWNLGRGTGSFLKGVISASVNGGDAEGEVVMDEVPPGATTPVGPFRAVVISTADLRLTLEVMDTRTGSDVMVHRHLMRLFYPDAVIDTSLVGIGQRDNIILTWTNPEEDGSGILGARVFRSLDSGGPFEPLLDGLVQGSVEGPVYYSDEGLSPLTRYYYQVSLVDASGNEGDRSIVLETTTSPGSVPGWPLLIDSVTRSSPTITELDHAELGDLSSGQREILFGSDIVYCLKGDGDEHYDGDQIPSTHGILTRPISTEGRKGHIWSKIATIDLDRDFSEPDIIVTHKDGSPVNGNGMLAVYNTEGERIWTRSLGRLFLGSPAIGNIDDDEEYEVVVANEDRVYAFNHDSTSATAVSGGRLFEITSADNMYQTPTLVDIDKDGKDEVIVVSWNGNRRWESPELWAVNGDGTNVPGFPVVLSNTVEGNVEGNTGQAVVADLDRDEEYEIAFLTAKRFFVFEHDGALKYEYFLSSGIPFANGGAGLQTPAIGDVDGNDTLEVVFATKKIGAVELHAVKGTAEEYSVENELEGFPVRLDDDGNIDPGSPILANMNDDPYPEIIIGDQLGRVHVYDRNGDIVNGFPYIVAGGDLRYGGLAAWDVDRDGHNNLVIQAWQSQEITVLDIALADFPTDSASIVAQNPWPMKHHDVRNSGNFVIPFLTPVLLSQLRAVEIEPGVVRIQFASSHPASEFRIWRLDPGRTEWTLRHTLEGDMGGFGFYEVFDEVELPGIYEYRVDLVDANGQSQEASRFEIDLSGVTARLLTLWPNRPNPFNPRTLLSFSIPGLRSTQVELMIHDLTGRVVRQLVQESLSPGFYEFEWDGRNDEGHPVSSGLYLARLKARGEDKMQKLMLLK
jgi:hypothetical protein